MKNSKLLALTGLLALTACSQDLEVRIKEGPYKGTYAVDTSSKPHTVKFVAPLTKSPSIGIITLYDDNLDGTPDRSLYSIYDTSNENGPNQGSVIRINLPETAPSHDEIAAYKEVMKYKN